MAKPPHPFIVDVEASGFGFESYPIEVGLALHDGERYCSLIKPADRWLHWDCNAERIHGITRERLVNTGRSVIAVASELNALLRGRTIYSDAWVVDKPWLEKLFAEARIAMRFSISQIELLLTEEQVLHWDGVKREMDEMTAGKRHRASHDALMIRRTYEEVRRRYPARSPA
ncbi:hypothetical protein Q4485_01790 [Granulosicoccaceae sp. 1_MG-2023]|nr:hypothetical protein [Granulosicoccaceae sp. 1_MG-2023]